MTTPNEAHEAIYKRFVDNFTLTDLAGNAIEYRFGLEEINPQNDNSYIVINAEDIISKQNTLGNIGNRKYELKGSINCKFGTLIESGQYVNDDIKNRLLLLFEGNSFSGVKTYDATIVPQKSDGYYMIKLISIEYSFFRTK